MNPLLNLAYEPAIASLGNDYYDDVAAADFPLHQLRWRNNDILAQLGLDPAAVADEDFVEAFGQFAGHPQPLLALRYHGYQFGYYNPQLGDGRGFLYGQVRGQDGELYDFGTKGSGLTPYSRGGDGMLTLKGGVREVIAAESLHRMGVRTSRCLSVVETGMKLWRGDEPSPTRSSVMVRFSRSHIRFGTFERLHYLLRPDLTRRLLDHIIAYYYPHLQESRDKYLSFYQELVERVATLAAQWMAAGFCHGVLNTDNMSITGESFDYGPFAFLPTYQPEFTAAYFDHDGRYSYGNQPGICKLNLELLQKPLAAAIDATPMSEALETFDGHYQVQYQRLLWQKLGLAGASSQSSHYGIDASGLDLLNATLELLSKSQVGYHDFFHRLADRWQTHWQQDLNAILTDREWLPCGGQQLEHWAQLYHLALSNLPELELEQVGENLPRNTPRTIPLRPVIEHVWEAISTNDDWQPFYELVSQLQA
jgi:serine/tyrosine/threonine adenylyltransferase